MKHFMKSLLNRIVLIAATVPMLSGCVVYRERPAPAYAPAPSAPPGDEVVVETPPAPPPVQIEVRPLPPGPIDVWFWVPGCWEWRGRYVWIAGRWAPRPHPGAAWIAGGWVRRGHHYVWVGGHWR